MNFEQLKGVPCEKRLRSLNDIRTYDDFIKIDVENLSERDIHQLRQGSYTDLIAVGYTCFFLASKNFEVAPISLSDVTRTLLRGHNITRLTILQKEIQIRKATNYENEVATLFEFLMYFIKVWKVACQTQLGKCFEQIYSFMSDIEALVYDFIKSILIDAEALKFKPSLIVVACISASFEVFYLVNFN